LQDKGLLSLAALVRARSPHRLTVLNLSGSGGGARGSLALLEALRQSDASSAPPTLTHLGCDRVPD